MNVNCFLPIASYLLSFPPAVCIFSAYLAASLVCIYIYIYICICNGATSNLQINDHHHSQCRIMYLYMYICVHKYVCAYVRVYKHVYVYMYVYIKIKCLIIKPSHINYQAEYVWLMLCTTNNISYFCKPCIRGL